MRAKKPYKKSRKRVGCGIGSGHGKRSTRGQKGQRSRSGYSKRHGFEGGQTPLYRRLPKRGFNHPAPDWAVVNVGDLAELKLAEVTPEIMRSKGLAKKQILGVKILGQGEIALAMTVSAHQFSASARQKIEKAGGKAVLINQAV